MSKIEYQLIGLGLLNLYLLFQVLATVTIANITAVLMYQMPIGYVSALTAIIGIVFSLRCLTRALLWLTSQKDSPTNSVRLLVRDTILVIAMVTILHLSNAYLSYAFNFVS